MARFESTRLNSTGDYFTIAQTYLLATLGVGSMLEFRIQFLQLTVKSNYYTLKEPLNFRNRYSNIGGTTFSFTYVKRSIIFKPSGNLLTLDCFIEKVNCFN